MSTIVQAKTLEHLQEIEALAKIIWTEHYTPIIGAEQVSYMLNKFQTVKAMEDQLKNGYSYFMILNNRACIGYFSYTVEERLLFLSKLYILKNMRGHGLGRIAISFIVNQARKLDLDKLRLTVNKNNVDSIQAYIKLGFEIKGTIVQDIGKGFVMDDYVLEKNL